MSKASLLLMGLVGILMSSPSAAEAGGYVIQTYYSPVAVAPVYAPANVIYPVDYPPVVRTNYYEAVPTVSYQPVYAVPAPLYVAPPAYYSHSASYAPNRVSIRVKEYAPYSWAPYRKQVYTEKWTPRGGVIRYRGF